jgi:ketosteroid isomerase-like protein
VSADEDELLARSREWDRAVQDRDGELAAAILSDGYELVLVQPAPSRMPRARWLEVLPEYVVHDWDVEEQLVDISGDTAAVLQRVRMDATVLGQDRSGIFVVSDIWRREGGSWRVWRRHSTPLTAGEIS